MGPATVVGAQNLRRLPELAAEPGGRQYFHPCTKAPQPPAQLPAVRHFGFEQDTVVAFLEADGAGERCLEKVTGYLAVKERFKSNLPGTQGVAEQCARNCRI